MRKARVIESKSNLARGEDCKDTLEVRAGLNAKFPAAPEKSAAEVVTGSTRKCTTVTISDSQMKSQLCYSSSGIDQQARNTIVVRPVVGFKPNESLLVDFGLDMDIAESIYVRGFITETEDLAFYSSFPLDMHIIKCMLGRERCCQIDNNQRKLYEAKLAKRDEKLRVKYDRQCARYNKPHVNRSEFCDNYSYNEFLIKKRNEGNFRSQREHPSNIFKQSKKFKNRKVQYPPDVKIKTECGMDDVCSSFTFEEMFGSSSSFESMMHSANESEGRRMNMAMGIKNGIGNLRTLFRQLLMKHLPENFASNIDELLKKINEFGEDYLSCGIFNMLVEAIILIYRLYKDKTITGTAFSFYHFFNMIGLPISTMFNKGVDWFFAIRDTDSKIVTESMEDGARNIYKFLNSLLSAKVVETFKTLLVSITSIKVFSYDWSKKINFVFGKDKKPTSLLELFHESAELIFSFLRVGDLLRSGVPFVDALLHKDPASQIIKDIRELLVWKDFLYFGNKVEGKMDRVIFAGKIRDYTETASRLLLSLKSKEVKKELDDLIIQMKKLYLESQEEMRKHERMAPIGVILSGPPGIGKSVLHTYICKIYCMAKGREFDFSQVFTRNPTSQYFEGLDPLAQDIYHYSELGNMHRNLAKAHGEQLLLEITSLMDSLPFSVDMAFDKKGKWYAHPGMIIIDTNNPDLNAKYTVSNPGAVKRRFLYIEPEVKRDYMKHGSSQLDSRKSIESGDPFMDRHTFKVYLYNALDAVECEKVPLLSDEGRETMDIYDMTRVVYKYMKDFITTQEMVFHRKGPDMEPQFYMDDEKSIVTESKFFDDIKNIKINFGKKQLVLPPVPRPEVNIEHYNDLPPRVKNEIPAPELESTFSVAIDAMGDMVNYFGVVSFSRTVQGVSELATKIHYSRHKPTGGLKTVLNIQLAYIALVFWMFACPAVYFLVPFFGTVMLNMGVVEGAKRFALDFGAQTWRDSSFKQSQLSWRKLKYRLGLNTKYDPLCSQWWQDNSERVIVVLGLFSTCIAIWKARNWYKNKGKKDYFVYPEVSKFHVDVPENKELEEEELAYHCGKSYLRIPKKTDNLWHIMEYNDRVSFSGKPEDLEATQAIKKNIRKTSILLQDEDVFHTHIVGVEGNIAVINRHALKSFPCTVRVSTTGGINPRTNTRTIDTYLNEEDIVKIGDDLVIFQVSGISFRPILKHFSPNATFFPLSEANIAGHNVMAIYTKDTLTMEDEKLGVIEVHGHFAYNWGDHAEGMCGVPLIISSVGGSCIAAIHCAGAEKEPVGFAIPIYRKMIIDGMAIMRNVSPLMNIHSEGKLVETQTGKVLDLVVPGAKSAFRFENLQALDFKGTLPGDVLAHGKSKLKTTPFRAEMKSILKDEMNFVTTKCYGPPKMQAFRNKEGEWINPFNIALRSMACQKKCLDKRILSKVSTYLTRYIIDSYKGRSLQPIDIETIVNGSEIDAYMRRMNTSTSAGFGWNGLKKDFLPVVVEEANRVTREPSQSLKRVILRVLKSLKSGETPRFVIKGALKDEAREYAKILTGKTRVFFVSPVEYVIISKMFTGPFYTHLTEFGRSFGVYIGINIYKEADKFVNDMKEFSHLWMEGDYRGFDLSIPYDIKWVVATIVMDVLKELGYDESQLYIVQGLLTEGLFPTINILNDIFVAAGVQCSGKDATAEDNSLVNLAMMLYFWFSSSHSDGLDFFSYVKPAVYGDDFLAAVKEAISHWFNNITYRDFCQSHFGIEVTSAAKDGTMTPFVDPDCASFLKRKFVYSDLHKRYVAQLDMESIAKSLFMYIPSPVVTALEQLEGTIRSALIELYMYCDKEQLIRIRGKFIDAYSEAFNLDRSVCEGRFPTYKGISDILEF